MGEFLVGVSLSFAITLCVLFFLEEAGHDACIYAHNVERCERQWVPVEEGQ